MSSRAGLDAHAGVQRLTDQLSLLHEGVNALLVLHRQASSVAQRLLSLQCDVAARHALRCGKHMGRWRTSRENYRGAFTGSRDRGARGHSPASDMSSGGQAAYTSADTFLRGLSHTVSKAVSLLTTQRL